MALANIYMATAILAVVGTAVVNAVAFSGSNYIFSKLDKDAAAEERRRKEAADEKYRRDRDEYNEQIRLHNEYVQARAQQMRDAESSRLESNQNAHDLFMLQEPEIPPEPVYTYQPSDEQRKHEISFQLIGSILVVILAFKLL
jgi:hypothetical protein